MKKFLILLISFAFICTVKATDIADVIIEGLPVKVISSGKSYKVFEQYPWEGHSSNYGPKGNRLNSSYGVGVGKNISSSLELRHGDWIHMPDIGWRQVNEFSTKMPITAGCDRCFLCALQLRHKDLISNLLGNFNVVVTGPFLAVHD